MSESVRSQILAEMVELGNDFGKKHIARDIRDIAMRDIWQPLFTGWNREMTWQVWEIVEDE